MIGQSMQNLVNFISLAVFTTLLALGQLMFKQIGLGMRGQTLIDGFAALLHQPLFYGAFAIYGLASFLWVWILSRVPLMQAYPWIAAGIVIVSLVGFFVFGERVGPLFWVGVVLILAGLMLTQYSGQV